MCVVDEMAITDTKLKALHGKKRDHTIELSDRDGLVASIGKSGKISWVLRYRFGGGQKRLTIGSYPALSIIEAREKLVLYNKALIDGRDPKHLSVARQTVTLDDCTKEWLSIKVGTLRTATQTLYKSQVNKHINNASFPHDVQKAYFEDWLTYFDRIAKQTSRVNSGAIFKTVKSILKWSRSRNLIQSSVLFDMDLSAVGESPLKGQRNLQIDEVGLLWNIVNQSHGSPALKACVKLLIIFGARNTEIREANRNEFDLVNNIWTLPSSRSKTGRAVRRPIPKLAIDIINELSDTYGDTGLLIHGKNRGSSLTTHAVARFISRSWSKLHAQYNIDKFVAHDFRRTLSTRLSEQGILPHVTEKMLGHELGGIMATYNKHDWIEEQVKGYELWCGIILKSSSDQLSRF